MKTWKVFCAVTTGIVLVVGLASMASSDSMVYAPTSWDQFQQCKIDCNEGYGGVDILPPAVRGGGAQGWANCVLKCERGYWKDVERDTSDMR